jgi:hypothetical protein
MLVYSVSSLQSFEMVQVIRDKILNHLVCTPLESLLFSLSLLPNPFPLSQYLPSYTNNTIPTYLPPPNNHPKPTPD